MQSIEFWFDFASPYSYLSAVRLERAPHAAFRAFLLGPIFRVLHGTPDSPFNRNAPRKAHMWQDVAREAEKLGVPFRVPSTFPRGSILASRIAVLADGEPWLPAFTRRVFEANFVHDRDIASTDVIREILSGVTTDADARIEQAEGPEAKARLFSRTEDASNLGIFGAPTFFVGRTAFWGNDRLTDAQAHAGAPLRTFEGLSRETARAFASEWLPAWTGNDPERLLSFYTDDALYVDPAVPQGIRGREAMLAYFTKLLGRYPTWVWTQRDAVPMESGFVNLWHASIPTGTQTIEVEGVCLVFLDPANGRIARNEVYFDRTKLFAK